MNLCGLNQQPCSTLHQILSVWRHLYVDCTVEEQVSHDEGDTTFEREHFKRLGRTGVTVPPSVPPLKRRATHGVY